MKLELDHEFIINIENDDKLSKECEQVCTDPVSTGIIVKMDYLKHKGWQTPEICSSNIGKLSQYQEYWLNRYSKAHTVAMKDDEDVIRVFRVAETVNVVLNECRRMQIPLIDEELFIDCIRAITEVHSKWIPVDESKIFHIDMYVIEASGRDDIEFQLIVTSELRSESNFALEMFSSEEESLKFSERSGENNLLKVDLCDKEGFIGNISNASVFIYMNDKVMTPSAPLGSGVYTDLMRESVITLIESEGIDVIEGRINIKECIDANKIGGIDEIFVTSIENGVQFITQWKHEDQLFVSKNASNTGFLRNSINGILSGKQEDWYRWVIYCNKHH